MDEGIDWGVPARAVVPSLGNSLGVEVGSAGVLADSSRSGSPRIGDPDAFHS